MKPPLLFFGLVPLSLHAVIPASVAASQFTRIEPVPVAAILDSSDAYPGGFYDVDNIVDGVADGSPRSEYSSAGKGTETFIDFDLGAPKNLAALKHVDRFDPATVSTSRLVLSNTSDFSQPLGVFQVDHANSRGGISFFTFPSPVTARYVRWKVTGLGPDGHPTVGGSEIALFQATGKDAAPVDDTVQTTPLPLVTEEDGKRRRLLEVAVGHPYCQSARAELVVGDAQAELLELPPGGVSVQVAVPAVDHQTPVTLSLVVAGRKVAQDQLTLKPVRPWTVCILPHSHVDIGYTHVQKEVERMQWSYLEQAIEIARRTADYPSGAQFKWNSEGLWAVDSYLRQASPKKRRELIEAVRRGWVHLDALYGNQLTGLCRPEELFRLLRCARRLSAQYDLDIDAAMISDVPGYTWGIVPVLSQSGVKYFSIGPNHCHRIGYTLDAWGDRPFYWVGPSGREKVLCWMAGKAYSWFHGGRLGQISQVDRMEILRYLTELSAAGYPYDLVQVRYSIGGDNGPPDPDLCQFVRDWNTRYIYPRLVIATTRELFEQFESRYGDQLPVVRGDFTPYWEDGAASSARETALARNASERLVQAEALWALSGPEAYPPDRFDEAWRNVLLYNEHTWGAHCSISQPDSQFTKDQWAIKQAFALEADKQSRQLLHDATSGRRSTSATVAAVDVYNLNSWPRTDMVRIAESTRPAGYSVVDEVGHAVGSQAVGEEGSGARGLWFLARDIPPFGAKRFYLQHGGPAATGEARLEGMVLSNQNLRLVIDPASGAIASLKWAGATADLVRGDTGMGLGRYIYVPGRNANEQRHSGKPQIVPFENGPLVASVKLATTDVPGCARMERIYRVFHGTDRVDIDIVLDKKPIRTKEGVHIAFPFQVPGGVMRMDVPWAVVQPEVDQLPGACKNYLTVGRWVDVSNDRYGVTWTTLDAPLIEVGKISMDVASPLQLTSWITHLKPTGTFYSYVMNNYWETNYKADQGGITSFRYSLRPHGAPDPAAAARWAIQRSQPLVVVPVDRAAPKVEWLLQVEPISVIATLLKPADNGRGLIVRLFNASERPQRATILWNEKAGYRTFYSSPFEETGRPVEGPVEIPPLGIATLRAQAE